jgi:hypothetical protein
VDTAIHGIALAWVVIIEILISVLLHTAADLIRSKTARNDAEAEIMRFQLKRDRAEAQGESVRV